MNIVVVDASETGAAELGAALQAGAPAPLQVTLTHTTEAALYALAQKQTDCLVVGVQDGPVELLHTLRAALDGRLPCATLALGRAGHDLAAAAAFRAGAHDYARRDDPPALLWATLDGCVESFGRLQSEGERREMLEYFLSESEAKSQLKSRFVANASHELRTPVSSMVGLVGLLEPHVHGEEGQALLATMSACCEGMLVVVDDLLDLTGLESGQIELRQENFGLASLVTRVVAAWRPVARDKQVALEWKATSEPLPVLQGDARRLRQVLFNTLGGALKFAHNRVELEVGSHSLGELVEVTVRVRVQGAELTESERRHLLDPFPDQARQGNDYANLGLAVATTLARAMQGSFACETLPGYGTLFTFCFMSPWAAEESAESHEGPVPSGKVLVAEDNPIVANIISLQLRGMGFQVTVVGDGVAAVEQARREPFAAVIMDCQMPRKDGLQATRELRELFSPDQLPIVALTASGQMGQAEQCLAVGMNDFLIKPATAEQLKAVLIRHARS